MPGEAADTLGARTQARLAWALLGYFGLLTLVITLSPFDFAAAPFQLTVDTDAADALANIALFLPLGFLMRTLDNTAARRLWRVVAIGAALSMAIEIAQVFIRGRYVSPIDVATNTLGAYAGAALRQRLERSSPWPAAVGRIGLDIPLVGLLYLLVPQLWLSSVGLVDDPRRSVTTLLLACSGSIVLVALNRHGWPHGVQLAARTVPPLAVLWFMIGALPALSNAPLAFGALAMAVVLVTFTLLRRDAEQDGRRFEVDTLRRFLPVFALYLSVSALWPPLRSIVPWHGALGFTNRLNDAGVVDVLVLLEQVGAFTLLGYAAAEWRGRRELTLLADLPRITFITATLAAALEAAQGVLGGPGASLLRALLSVSGAAYGAAVYHFARDHVRALRAGQAARPSHRAA